MATMSNDGAMVWTTPQACLHPTLVAGPGLRELHHISVHLRSPDEGARLRSVLCPRAGKERDVQGAHLAEAQGGDIVRGVP